MTKDRKIYGIDISKDVFDYYNESSGHHQLKNDASGFKTLLKELPKAALVVMEATGYYHYRLAQFLLKKGIAVSDVNPLSVKRFIQMKLAKVKTDKSDAKAICEYGIMNDLPMYSALTDVQAECLQLIRLLDNYLKQRTTLKNKRHGERSIGNTIKFCISFVNTTIKAFKQRDSRSGEPSFRIGKTGSATSINLT